MTDREPYKWITVKGKHIPVYKDEHGDDVFGAGGTLADRIEKQFIDRNSYIYSDEYKRLSDKTSSIRRSQEQLSERRKELRDIVSRGTTVSEEDVEMLGKSMAEMLGKRTPEAEEAQKELFNSLDREHELSEELESAESELKQYIKLQNAIQKDELVRQDSTIAKVKDSYKHFQFDTGVSKYRDLAQDSSVSIIEMSPKEYLQRCGLDIFGTTYERQVGTAMADADTVTGKLYDLMQGGTKMYMPVLNYRDSEQEGRHRAVAAMLHGDEKIPVMLVLPKGRRLIL